jgi:hypothetical protein
LALLASVFQSVELVKPRASKNANNEVYVVARRIRSRIEPRLLDSWLSSTDNLSKFDYDRATHFPSLSESMERALFGAVSTLVDTQVAALGATVTFHETARAAPVNALERHRAIAAWLRDTNMG